MKTLRVELRKLFKRKSTKILLLIYGFVVLLMSAVYVWGETHWNVTLYTEGQYISASLGVMMQFILPFISLYVASSSFALDFGKGTIKNMLLLPIQNSQIFYSKIMAVQSLIGALLGIQFVVTMLVGLFMDGWFSWTLVLINLAEYLGAFVVLGLISLIGATLYLFFSSVGLTILVTYLCYVGMGIGSLYWEPLRIISITQFIKHYEYLFTEMNGVMLLAILAYYIILITTGSFIFESKAKRQLVDFE